MQMPQELVDRARQLADGGQWAVPDARPATTVVLLRDGGHGLEVLLMQRPRTMAFAPGMHVFPGGRVDLASDSQLRVHGFIHTGQWAADRDLSRALVAAGVRETFEEAGVLLALDRTGRPPQPDETWEADRLRCERPGGFAEVLARRRLHLDADLLAPIAHWVTPEIEGRRFDTRFLVAALPVGQNVDRHATETDTATWLTPGDALAGYASGDVPMLPPTVAVLGDLAGQRSVVDVLEWARGRTIVPLMPRPQLVGDEVQWALVHAYTGAVLSTASEPAGSEERGLG